MFRQKETPIGYYTAIILNYRNVTKHLWREPQIIKFENAFHIWINIGYICERAHSAMSRVKSRFHERLTVRSHRRRRERQSGRKSFIFNVSRRRAPARAARRVLDGESVEQS